MDTKKIKVDYVKGDSEGGINELIEWLIKARDKGATNYEMEWSGDPMWAFKWFRAYKMLTDEEIKVKEIEELKNKLKKLEQ